MDNPYPSFSSNPPDSLRDAIRELCKKCGCNVEGRLLIKSPTNSPSTDSDLMWQNALDFRYTTSSLWSLGGQSDCPIILIPCVTLPHGQNLHHTCIHYFSPCHYAPVSNVVNVTSVLMMMAPFNNNKEPPSQRTSAEGICDGCNSVGGSCSLSLKRHL